MAAVLACIRVASAQCPGSFGPPATYAVGDFAWDLASADLNGDGRPDLAVVNANSNNVSILLALPAGGFAPAVNYPTGTTPQAVQIADFNGDGAPDLVVGNQTSNNISMLRGTGNGTFQPAVHTPAGLVPNGLVVGDFNLDGRPDAALANNDSHTISVFLCTASGTLAPAITYAAGDSPFGLAVGDLNADGSLDLVAANQLDDTVSVLLGTPIGTFQPRVPYSVGNQPQYLAVGDLNGDGRADVAAVDRDGNGTVSVLFANPDGTLLPRVGYLLPSGSSARSVAMGDLNSDGWLDLVVTRGSGRNFAVLVNRGGANPGFFNAPVHFPMALTQFALVIRDFNGDGMPDIACANANANTADVVLNRGGFGPPPITVQPVVPPVVIPGQTIDLSVQATGLGLSYRWRRGGVPLSDTARVTGTASPAIRISQFQSVDEGTYDCVVTDASSCVATSAPAPITCRPVITAQPVSHAALVAGLQVGVGVPAGAPYSYRWRRNGENLFNIPGSYSGVTTPTLTILTFNAAFNGLYDVVVTDACGSTISTPSLITCEPIITVQPPTVAALVGGATLGATVASGGVVAYQWRRGEQIISDIQGTFEGSTSATLRILRDDPALTGEYMLSASNDCGTVDTSTTTVTCGVPQFGSPPPLIRLAAGERLTLTIPPGTAYGFRWRQFGQPVPEIPGLLTGGTSDTLAFHAVDSSLAGDYDCVVTSPCGQRVSAMTRVHCSSDFNIDGLVNPDDLADYINCHFATTPCDGADFNRDGDTNADDLGDFINAYFGPAC